MMFYFPLLLTLSRAVMTPIIWYCVYTQSWLYAIILLSIAIISDMLDGFLARILQAETVIGALLDPCIDKIMQVGLLYIVSFVHGYIPTWFVLFFLIKELIVLGGAVWCVWGHALHVQADLVPKVATNAVLAWMIWAVIAHILGTPLSYVALQTGCVVSSFILIGTVIWYAYIIYKQLEYR